MRKIIRFLLLKPVQWAATRFSSRPDRRRVFAALDKLYRSLLKHPGRKGLTIPFEYNAGKFIIFSDQHKGARNGADDFMGCEENYLAALDYYDNHDFLYINLGDCEELWENSMAQVKKHNTAEFLAEKKFLSRNAYVKIFGNHDLYWDNAPQARWQLKSIYGEKVKVYEGVILATDVPSPSSPSPEGSPATPLFIFCTHGHQGDASSDGNWFSKFFIANIWAPLQAYLRINPNTPAYNAAKKTLHNTMMYQWSAAQKNTLLITGHTHQPVFESLTLFERLYKEYQQAEADNASGRINELKGSIREREKDFTMVPQDYLSMLPSYFNSGCCCFSDGDITGIEIEAGMIRLIKWTRQASGSRRVILDETSLAAVATAVKQ